MSARAAVTHSIRRPEASACRCDHPACVACRDRRSAEAKREKAAQEILSHLREYDSTDCELMADAKLQLRELARLVRIMNDLPI